MTVEIQHSFDVLKTIAQLPNDEAYTSPEVVNDMLDLLPAHVWSEPDYTWLDPAAKSGVFLREIARRLMVGLSEWETDETIRRAHIYRKMLYGSATSQLSGEIARRTLYHSKDATGAGLRDDQLKDLIIQLDHPDGNVPFIDTEHEFTSGRRSCVRCGSAPDVERGPTRENYAYPFIHMTYPTEEMSEMKFDVIVGNPPYQLKGGGGGTNDSPIYQYFVERAIDMDPRYLVMITPSRWFTGGRGLDTFRDRMVADRRLRHVVDNPKLFDVFPMVEIKGGVSYFLWDREHNDDCTVETRIDGQLISKNARDLRKGRGVLVRSNEAAPIVEKVIERGEPALDARISPDTPFGLATNFKGWSSKRTPGTIRLLRRGLESAWVKREVITKNVGWIGGHKVFIPKAGDGHGRIPAVVLGRPVCAPPDTVCTQTFLIAGSFKSKEESENYAAYLRTKFVRFLVLQRKASQDNYADTFGFVPDLPMDREWTDQDLYKRYKLTKDEIEVIESQIKGMPAHPDDEGDA